MNLPERLAPALTVTSPFADIFARAILSRLIRLPRTGIKGV